MHTDNIPTFFTGPFFIFDNHKIIYPGFLYPFQVIDHAHPVLCPVSFIKLFKSCTGKPFTGKTVVGRCFLQRFTVLILQTIQCVFSGNRPEPTHFRPETLAAESLICKVLARAGTQDERRFSAFTCYPDSVFLCFPQVLQISLCTLITPPQLLHFHFSFSAFMNSSIPLSFMAFRFWIMLILYRALYLLSMCLISVQGY